MNVEVVLLPAYLNGQSLHGKTVIVIDALRATSTITYGLAAGIREIRIFPDFESAKLAADKTTPRPILCGEVHALPPPGADLGNSPRQWLPEHAGRDVFLATTNGTKAMIAVRTAGLILAGALVNRTVIARAAARNGGDVLILCSGTDGKISLEDTLCAGAILEVLASEFSIFPSSDIGRVSVQAFLQAKDKLPSVLRDGQGGRNNIAVGLEGDIDFCARLDAFDLYGVVDPESLIIRAKR